MILIIGMLVSFFLSGNAQSDVADSVLRTVHLYDSLIFPVENDTSLLKKRIIGARESKSFEGFAFITTNKNEVSKLDLLIDNSDQNRVIIYLHKNKMIGISIAGVSYYIIDVDCFMKGGTLIPVGDKFLKSIPWYQSTIKDLVVLLFAI